MARPKGLIGRQGTMRGKGRPEALEEFGIRLGRIARLWRGEIDRRMSRHGLTQARWLALLHLSRIEPPVKQATLAAVLGVQGPTLVRMLDRLESDGLVTRCGMPGDRRAKSLRLTARAAPGLARIHAVGEDLREEIFAGIGDAELRTCLRVFDHLLAKLDRGAFPTRPRERDAS